MPIKVDYTPYAALYDLSTEAGQAQARTQEVEQQTRMKMAEMNDQLQRDSWEFEQRAEQEARAEDYQRTIQLAQAKQQIDMQGEIQMYAQKRNQFMSDISQIQEADFLNKEDKEKLQKKAYSKYFGVTDSTTMENFFAKQKANQMQVNMLQEQVKQGALTPEAAREEAAALGIPYSANMFKPPEQIAAEKRKPLLAEQAKLRAELRANFQINNEGWGTNNLHVKDPLEREWVRATKEEEAEYKALVQRLLNITNEVNDLDDIAPADDSSRPSLEELDTQAQQGPSKLRTAAGMMGKATKLLANPQFGQFAR